MKLTMINVCFRGVNYVRFVLCEYINGKCIIPKSFLEDMACELGCGHGMTYSYG